MRLVTIGIVALALMGVGLAYYIFVERRPAEIAALVPEDFSHGLFYRSVNDLRGIYEGPYARKDADPARLRIGGPVNAPGLDGLSYTSAVGSYVTRDGDEVFLLPIIDLGALEEEFERERENLRMRAPERVAGNYASMSEARIEARRGPPQQLVRRAAYYPLALAGRPVDGTAFRRMLAYLWEREAPRKPERVPLLGRVVRGLSPAAAEIAARECDDFVLGIRTPGPWPTPLRVDVEATPRAGGMLARAAPLARDGGLHEVVASFPFYTVLLVGAVLDGAAWEELALELPLGDGAFAFGITERPHHARRYNLLVAARPRDKADLGRLLESGWRALLDPGREVDFEAVDDEGAEVLTATLPGPPDWLASLLRSSARQEPPVFVSMVVERGIWYAAVGSQAEAVVRHALGSLRRAPELGLQRSPPVADHPELLHPGHTAVAMVTAAGVKALGVEMPVFEIASLGAPSALTAALDLRERAQVDLRVARASK